jgi:hypothetical protein
VIVKRKKPKHGVVQPILLGKIMIQLKIRSGVQKTKVIKVILLGTIIIPMLIVGVPIIPLKKTANGILLKKKVELLIIGMLLKKPPKIVTGRINHPIPLMPLGRVEMKVNQKTGRINLK